MAKDIERQGGPIPKEKREEIKEELRKIVTSGEILGTKQENLRYRILERNNTNVKLQTIKKLLDEVYQEVPKEEIEKVEVKIEAMFNKLFADLRRLIDNAPTEDDKRKAIDMMIKAMDRFISFLESFGRKVKPQENININGQLEHSFQFNYIVPGESLENDNEEKED